MAGTAATSRIPFADTSPEEIPAALLPEELPEFEEQYQEALRAPAETYRLDKLEACLRSWRRIAWMIDSDPEAHRLMLARAEYTLAIRERVPATDTVEPYPEAEAAIAALAKAARRQPIAADMERVTLRVTLPEGWGTRLEPCWLPRDHAETWQRIFAGEDRAGRLFSADGEDSGAGRTTASAGI